MFSTAEVRSIAVGGQQLRVAVRRGRRDRVPLLLINGIGASLDLLQPFVDEVDPSVEVIRFDVPGAGGSSLPVLPYRFTGLCRMISGMLSELGYASVDVASPGAAAWRSTWPSCSRLAAAGWCSSARRPAR
jgi:pimeloyl-ACP methyl ester carboxylesterase